MMRNLHHLTITNEVCLGQFWFPLFASARMSGSPIPNGRDEAGGWPIGAPRRSCDWRIDSRTSPTSESRSHGRHERLLFTGDEALEEAVGGASAGVDGLALGGADAAAGRGGDVPLLSYSIWLMLMTARFEGGKV